MVYPLITDGLALVAYAATMRLTGGAGATRGRGSARGRRCPGSPAHRWGPAPVRRRWCAAVAGAAVRGRCVAGDRGGDRRAHLLFMLGADARAHRGAEHPPATAPPVQPFNTARLSNRRCRPVVQPGLALNIRPRPTRHRSVQPAARRALPVRSSAVNGVQRPTPSRRPRNAPGPPPATTTVNTARCPPSPISGTWPRSPAARLEPRCRNYATRIHPLHVVTTPTTPATTHDHHNSQPHSTITKSRQSTTIRQLNVTYPSPPVPKTRDQSSAHQCITIVGPALARRGGVTPRDRARWCRC